MSTGRRTITIVLQDLDKGRGCTVLTDAGAPAIGQPCTPAQSLAMDLLRVCNLQASSVQYGQSSATLAGELVQTVAAEHAQ